VKLGLSMSGVNDTIKVLGNIYGVSVDEMKKGLVKNVKEIRDKAKEILENKVSKDPRYSIGTLRDSIGVTSGNIETEYGSQNVATGRWAKKQSKPFSVSVGPDMRKAPWADWVEIGHYMTGGWVKKGNIKGARWWEGHHYMEGAWLEVSPKIIPKIAETLSVKMNSFARSAKRTRHKTTGRFVAGWGGYD